MSVQDDRSFQVPHRDANHSVLPPIKKPPFSDLTDLPSPPLAPPLLKELLKPPASSVSENITFPSLPIQRPERPLDLEALSSALLTLVLFVICVIWILRRSKGTKQKSLPINNETSSVKGREQRYPVAEISAEITADTARLGKIEPFVETASSPKLKTKPRYYQGYFRPQNPRKYRGDLADIYFRSSWEKKAFIYCDRNPRIIAWASEEIQIPYFLKGTGAQYSYTPDLMIYFENREVVMVEIKPKAQVKNPDIFNISKWAAARAECAKNKWQFQIWTEDTIQKLQMSFEKHKRKNIKK